MLVRRTSLLLCALLLPWVPGCLLDRTALGPNPDAGGQVDAGPARDASGIRDAGQPDSGPPAGDSGPLMEDGGPADAGPIDAGPMDAGPMLEVPGAPGVPTFSEVETTSMRVSWTAPATGGPVVSYELQRAPDSAPTAFMTVGTPTARTLLDGSLGVDSGYWYRVRAVNEAGEGPYSAAGTQKTGALLPVLRRQSAERDTTDPTATFPMVPLEGSLLVAIAAHRLDNAASSIEGWTQRVNEQFRTDDGNRRQLVVFTRIAGAGENTEVTLDWSGNRYSRLLIQEFDLRGGSVEFAAQASSNNEDTRTTSLSATQTTAAAPLFLVGALGARDGTGNVRFTELGSPLVTSAFVSLASGFGERNHAGAGLTINADWDASRRASLAFVAFRREP